MQPFLDVRTAELNDVLEDAFRRHHPGFRLTNDDYKLTQRQPDRFPRSCMLSRAFRIRMRHTQARLVEPPPPGAEIVLATLCCRRCGHLGAMVVTRGRCEAGAVDLAWRTPLCAGQDGNHAPIGRVAHDQVEATRLAPPLRPDASRR